MIYKAAFNLFKIAGFLLAIATLNFLLIHLAPGDPAVVLAGELGAVDEQTIATLRQQFGLDQPIYVQLLKYVSNIARLELGYSFRQGAPVLQLIMERLPATLLLTMTAFGISLVCGVALGVATSARAGKPFDNIISTLALVFYATPLFWIALMGVLVFSVWLDLLPPFGYETIGAGYKGIDRVLDVLKHLVLPAATLGVFFISVYLRMTRASMLEVAQQDFIRTAKAKGVPPSIIRYRHILRNAVLPVITLAGMQAGQLVGGAVLTETVFAWPGIGRLMYESLAARDYNTILGIFLVSAAMVILFNMITDILYRVVDPRIEGAA